jgi:hypothetical protein
VKTLLCIGGPVDGEVRAIHEEQRYLIVVVAPPMRLPIESAAYTPDIEELRFVEHEYRLLRLEQTIEFLYYAPDGATRAFQKLFTCYAPRLAKMAEDEQRRVERQLPPSDLQAKR